MTRILISDAYAQEGLELLDNADDVELVNQPGMSAEELLEVIDSFDGLGVRSATKVTPEVIAASKGRLKVVVRAGVWWVWLHLARVNHVHKGLDQFFVLAHHLSQSVPKQGVRIVS